MSLANRISIALSCSAILWMTGCCGPMGCGPTGVNGPFAFNSCDGCGECEGCGELYIDPWINEPADCCDPCDRCGNYNGQSCGKCRSVFAGFPSLWGYRCDPTCGSCGVGGCDGGCCDSLGCEPGCGCETCAPIADCEPACGCEPGCGCESCAPIDHYGPGCGCETCGPVGHCDPGCGCETCASVAGDGVIPIASEPTRAREIIEASPLPPPYKPRRTRQIFKPRGNVAEGRAITITR